MENSHFPYPASSLQVTIVALVVPFICYLLWIVSKPIGNKKILPAQPSGSWPIVGHLHLLVMSQRPSHITLGKLADKYGPIFMIKLGVHPYLVISNSEMAKECLATNDRTFASRPKALATEIMGYNYTMPGFNPYGPYWRHMRKILTAELLSNSRLEKLRYLREAEVKAAVEGLYRKWIMHKTGSDMVLVDMKRWFKDIALNNVLQVVVGRRYAEYTDFGEDHEDGGSGWRHAIREFMDLAGKFVVSDAIPFLRFLDLGGVERMMKKTAKELDLVVQRWLDEHRQNLKTMGGKGLGEGEDFMYVMLSILVDLKTDVLFNRDPDTINKATCLALILAASETTSITLTWTLSLLLNNRDVLKKAQEELDSQVGRERQVIGSDVKNLAYLQAILKESLRLYPAAPLSLQHESMEDCTVGGYHVPAGTRLIVNLSKIHQDPRTWVDADKFRPERFLTTHKSVDVTGQSFELLPFGSGRRMCPGISFALHILHLTLANLLHGFEIETPSGKPVDMTAGSGTTSPKVTPLETLLTLRLPAHLYEG